MHQSWEPLLSYSFPIIESIKKQIGSASICPVDGNAFRAFSLPVQEVKVVLLGQDPYPNPADATGIAFGVQADRLYKHYPFSLKVLADALTDEADTFFDPSLEMWVRQGFLMLNSALTCQQSKPGSHQEIWKPFMAELFKQLNLQESLIFVFFGKVAEQFSNLLDNNKHTIITCPHPAALAYGNTISKTVFHKTFKDLEEAYQSKYNEQLTLVLPF